MHVHQFENRCRPRFEYPSPQGERRSFPVYYDRVRRLAATKGVPLAEPAKSVPPTLDYFTDWCHFTAKEEQLRAQIWFDTLEQASWFGAKADNGKDGELEALLLLALDPQRQTKILEPMGATTYRLFVPFRRKCPRSVGVRGGHRAAYSALGASD